MLRREFHAVRMLRGDQEILAAIAEVPSPVIVLVNHPSWWDPLVALALAWKFMPQRTPCGPMDAAQLRRFGFFRRLGIFGVELEDARCHDDQDDDGAGNGGPDGGRAHRRHGEHGGAAALAELLARVDERFSSDALPALWITPQGRFSDAREPIRIRPGAAAVAAAHPGCRVAVANIEYAFWQDRRPEVFVACRAIAPPSGASSDGAPGRVGTTAWHRAMRLAMQANADRLAEAVVARDPAAFDLLIGGGSTRIQPIYDLWLRLRGRGGEIIARREP